MLDNRPDNARPVFTCEADFSAEVARELFAYDPLSGLLTWKPRSQRWFKDARGWKRWNTRFAGAVAGWREAKGYLRVEISRRFRPYVHRVAFLMQIGEWPNGYVDHANHVRSDNRFNNLRVVTHDENMKNVSMRTDNTSGVTGVIFDKRTNSWKVRIRVFGRKEYFGSYKIKSEADQIARHMYRVHDFHPHHGKLDATEEDHDAANIIEVCSDE